MGGIVSQGSLPAYSRIAVKFRGPFMRMPIGKLELAKLKSPGLRDVFARYADCLLAQIFQSTACNAIHSIEQRTAKWIISAMDRTGSDLVPLTHEQLAGMLGVGRSYASRVIQTFKVDGILETRPGAIPGPQPGCPRRQVMPVQRISLKTHFEEVLRGVYPTEEAGAAAS